MNIFRAQLRGYLLALRLWWGERPRWGGDTRTETVKIPVDADLTAAVNKVFKSIKETGQSMEALGEALLVKAQDAGRGKRNAAPIPLKRGEHGEYLLGKDHTK